MPHKPTANSLKPRDSGLAPRPPKSAPALCTECRAVLTRGRWTWDARLSVPADICLPATLCPACRRVRDRDPAHVVGIEGKDSLSRRDRDARVPRRSEAAVGLTVDLDAGPRRAGGEGGGSRVGRAVVDDYLDVVVCPVQRRLHRLGKELPWVVAGDVDADARH